MNYKVLLRDLTMKEVYETLGKLKDFKEKLKQELVKTNCYAVSVEEYAQRSFRTLKNNIRSPVRQQHLRSESFRSVTTKRSKALSPDLSAKEITQPTPNKPCNLAKLLANTKVALPRFKLLTSQSTGKSRNDAKAPSKP